MLIVAEVSRKQKGVEAHLVSNEKSDETASGGGTHIGTLLNRMLLQSNTMPSDLSVLEINLLGWLFLEYVFDLHSVKYAPLVRSVV